MVKNKRKSMEEVESDVAEDSMIENGTSEGDSEDSMDDIKIQEYLENDDGFSEREELDSSAKDKEKAQKEPKSKRKVKEPMEASVTTVTQAKLKKTNPDKMKPPTLEEINELKETRNLFHSNLFRLQVKEMLAELKVKDKYHNYVNNWLEHFKQFLSKLQTQPQKEDMNKQGWIRSSKIKLPISLENLGVQQLTVFQFQFIKAKVSPYLIGAAATQTLLGPKLVADICLAMPEECFQKENYLNLIYDQKRAYYLTYIANKLLSSAEFGNELTIDKLKFSYYNNNPLKAVLEIAPTLIARSSGKINIANKLLLRLFITAEESSFKLSRFVPWNNNVRARIFGDDDEETLPMATPNYNAGVLFDLTMQRNQQLLHGIFDGRKNFQEGLVLLKVWLRQREFDVGFNGFSAHLLAMFVSYLYKQRKLHVNMSSYQVARTVWNQLAYSAWDEDGKGISLSDNSTDLANQPTLEQFHTYYDVVFVDATGFYNMAANLTPDLYRRVRLEAKLAVDMLNDMKINSFQILFMTKFPLYSQFDNLLKINKRDIVEQIIEMHVAPADKYNFAGYTHPLLLKVVVSLLRKGLGERVRALLPIEQPTDAWTCTDKAPDCARYCHLGIVLNPEKAFEVLDKGPESIAESANEFRKFWGDKAQLRRFQDGSITESVVWAATTDSLWKRRLVVRSIIAHLLQHHFQLENKDFDYIAGELDISYRLTPIFKTEKMHEKFKVEQDVDAEDTSLHVIRSFDDLARKLHALNELPLEIVSISGISPVFRYCEPVPILPQARTMGEQIYAMQVQYGVIQLGLSGKWPSELGALRALKVAFYIQIAKLLREKHNLRAKVTYDGILVNKQGYCFAIEMAHPKEVALLKKEKSERGLIQYVDCEASIALEKRHYVLPKVTGALHALYQVHNSFGGTVMIAKRWLGSQLLDNGIWPEECTELLIAAQYLKTPAQQIPCSPQTGFIRFLQLLAGADWRSELFLLNFNNTMDENAVADLEHRFSIERDTFPPLCIATSFDQQHMGNLWTSLNKPNVNVLARATLLARHAVSIIEGALLSTKDLLKPGRIFIASNSGYDLVIQLKPDMVPNSWAHEFGTAFTVRTKPNWRLPLADSNFLQNAVAKLREAYSDFAAFFYNPHGGKEIALIWKPDLSNERDFKVTEVNGCALSSKNAQKVVVKKEILIEDFKFILKDIYQRIGTVDEVLSASRNATIPNVNEKMHIAGPKSFNRNLGENRYFSKSDVDEAITEKIIPNLKSSSKNANIKAKQRASKNKSAKGPKIGVASQSKKIKKKVKSSQVAIKK
ncbi:PREDICTED: nucleolar protein 6 [Rhagoletis zephyria]|uniref:nucleolar protein 6 n=1 Tax=Rhagoletis zephyria TaxID=28612 RepID=UPI00081128DA|nr:PREDICTED: nucleolar protein 6 [Rhagoletis zephyria]